MTMLRSFLTPNQRNVAVYFLLGLILVVAQWANSAIVAGEVDWFSGPVSMQYRGLALAILGYVVPALTLAVAAYRSKVGREDISGLVTEVGVPQAKAALEVEAVKQATGITGLAPEQVADIVAAVKAEMVRDPEGRLAAPRVPADPLVSKPPT